MNRVVSENNELEYQTITKMLLKGSTIAEIAIKLNYSESTVSNRLNELFKKYQAKNRFEFIYNFFSKIIQNYKIKLKLLNKQNKELKSNLIKIKNILSDFEFADFEEFSNI